MIANGALHACFLAQQSPIPLGSDGEFETLLPGKNVSFTATDGDNNTPDWTHALLDGSVHLTDMKEVSSFVMFAALLWRQRPRH